VSKRKHNIMRVYVCGAHSSGKTTLGRHIAAEMGLPLINEVARQVMAEMELTFEVLRANLDLVDKYQKAVFRRQIEVEESYPDGFVSDRAFCNLAYAGRHSRILRDIVKNGDVERYMNHVADALVLFVRPSRVCMVDDGMREQVNWDEINRIDGMIDLLFEMYSVPRVGIAESGMKDRMRTAMAAVRWYTKSLGA
jgi:nicotinamide riboside kinase